MPARNKKGEERLFLKSGSLGTPEHTTTTREYAGEIGYQATYWRKYVLHASFVEFITHIEITITRM